MIYIVARDYQEATWVANQEVEAAKGWCYVSTTYQVRGVGAGDEVWLYRGWYESWSAAATIELRYCLLEAEGRGCEVVDVTDESLRESKRARQQDTNH